MEKFRILKNGIGIHHANKDRSGFLFEQAGYTYMLVRMACRHYDWNTYLAVFLDCTNELITTTVTVYDDTILHKGKLVNHDFSERRYCCCEATVTIDL